MEILKINEDQLLSRDNPVYGKIEAFLLSCARTLDDDDLERWPEYFVPNCRYIIQPLDNYKLGLSGYWLYFDNQSMLRDRILSLREANLYNIHQDRRLVSNIEIEQVNADFFKVRSTYLMVQTDQDGHSRLFNTGVYFDQIVLENGQPKFKERLVMPDTANVVGLIAIPI